MNIIKFEIKRQWITLCLWTILFIAVMLALFIGVYPLFRDSLKDIMNVISSMPQEFLKAFSVNLNTMADFSGFYEFSYAYLSLMGAIMSASFGLAIFGREKKVKCTDFLFTKPCSRQNIFVNKYVTGLILIVVFNIFYAAISCFYGIKYDNSFGTMILASSMMFLTQLFFYHAAILVAIYLKKIRSVSNTATLIGFAGFIIVALNNILEIDGLQYLSPLKYFDPIRFFGGVVTDWSVMIVGCVLLVLFIMMAFILYIKQDVKAV